MKKDKQLQFNKMLTTLKKISKRYESPERLRRNSEKEYGLEYEEALEMAYDNIQTEATICIKGIRPIKLEQQTVKNIQADPQCFDQH